jgi:hypothetical protein
MFIPKFIFKAYRKENKVLLIGLSNTVIHPRTKRYQNECLVIYVIVKDKSEILDYVNAVRVFTIFKGFLYGFGTV